MKSPSERILQGSFPASVVTSKTALGNEVGGVEPLCLSSIPSHSGHPPKQDVEHPSDPLVAAHSTRVEHSGLPFILDCLRTSKSATGV